jgi:hypothetical protein
MFRLTQRTSRQNLFNKSTSVEVVKRNGIFVIRVRGNVSTCDGRPVNIHVAGKGAEQFACINVLYDPVKEWYRRLFVQCNSSLDRISRQMLSPCVDLGRFNSPGFLKVMFWCTLLIVTARGAQILQKSRSHLEIPEGWRESSSVLR